ncbi:DNA topoisomerase 3-alpha [Dionaea muscipula]
MEGDMKGVSMGMKVENDVQTTCLQQIKLCFLDHARLNKIKLLEAMKVFFDRSNRSRPVEQNMIGAVVRRCILCQQFDMVLKHRPVCN